MVMKDLENKYWKYKDVLYFVEKENPKMSKRDVEDKAREIYLELKNLNSKSNYNRKKYFKHNTPMSSFEVNDLSFSY